MIEKQLQRKFDIPRKEKKCFFPPNSRKSCLRAKAQDKNERLRNRQKVGLKTENTNSNFYKPCYYCE